MTFREIQKLLRKDGWYYYDTAYSQKYSSRKSVKKTLTIPMWLNERAEKCGINFSKTLQDALLKKIIIKNK